MTIDLIYPGSPEMLRLAVRAGYHDFPDAMCAVTGGDNVAFLHLDRASGNLLAKEWKSGDGLLHELLDGAAVMLGRSIVAIVPPETGARASRLEMVTAIFEPRGELSYRGQPESRAAHDRKVEEVVEAVRASQLPIIEDDPAISQDTRVRLVPHKGKALPKSLPDGKEPGEAASESKGREAISPWQLVLERELVPFSSGKGKIVIPRDNATGTIRIAYNGPGEGRVSIYPGAGGLDSLELVDVELEPGIWALEFDGNAGDRFSVLAWAPDEGACTYKIEIYWEAA